MSHFQNVYHFEQTHLTWTCTLTQTIIGKKTICARYTKFLTSSCKPLDKNLHLQTNLLNVVLQFSLLEMLTWNLKIECKDYSL
jgi:hypothetical protein